MAKLIKICGLKTEETLDAALEAGADLVGFVFFPLSPRHLEFDRARMLSRRVGRRAGIVALSVDADDSLLADIIDAVDPLMMQLHGQESEARVETVRAVFKRPVMKALPVETRADLACVEGYARVADRLLFDARAPREATRPGGLGRRLDWHLLADVRPGRPFLVSGGLDAANVAEALAITGADGVDVSSGVETAPGVKDAGKVRDFVAAVRAAEIKQTAS